MTKSLMKKVSWAAVAAGGAVGVAVGILLGRTALAATPTEPGGALMRRLSGVSPRQLASPVNLSALTGRVLGKLPPRGSTPAALRARTALSILARLGIDCAALRRMYDSDRVRIAYALNYGTALPPRNSLDLVGAAQSSLTQELIAEMNRACGISDNTAERMRQRVIAWFDYLGTGCNEWGSFDAAQKNAWGAAIERGYNPREVSYDPARPHPLLLETSQLLAAMNAYCGTSGVRVS
jgi:hypothetical protein